LEKTDGNWSGIDLRETQIEINGNLQSINNHLFAQSINNHLFAQSINNHLFAQSINNHLFARGHLGDPAPIVNDKVDKIIIPIPNKIRIKVKLIMIIMVKESLVSIYNKPHF